MTLKNVISRRIRLFVPVQIYMLFGNKCVNVGHTNLEERIMQISPILEKLGDRGNFVSGKVFNTR